MSASLHINRVLYNASQRNSRFHYDTQRMPYILRDQIKNESGVDCVVSCIFVENTRYIVSFPNDENYVMFKLAYEGKKLFNN